MLATSERAPRLRSNFPNRWRPLCACALSKEKTEDHLAAAMNRLWRDIFRETGIKD